MKAVIKKRYYTPHQLTEWQTQLKTGDAVSVLESDASGQVWITSKYTGRVKLADGQELFFDIPINGDVLACRGATDPLYIAPEDLDHALFIRQRAMAAKAFEHMQRAARDTYEAALCMPLIQLEMLCESEGIS